MEPQPEIVLDGPGGDDEVAHGYPIRERAGGPGADDQVYVPDVIQQMARVNRKLGLAVTAPREGGADLREDRDGEPSHLRLPMPQAVRPESVGQGLHLGL